MKVSETGLKLIKHYEGLRLTGYICPAGKATIGYGWTGLVNDKPIIPNKTKITNKEAEELLLHHIKSYEIDVNSVVKIHLKQHQFDALVSFVYNLGINNLKLSTLLKELNKNNMINVGNEFLKWDKAVVKGKLVQLQGLKKRRLSESTLFTVGKLLLY